MLDKKYNHLDVEKDRYQIWKDKGYFNCGDKSKKPFCIVIPPPNVTGKLHLGHALNNSIQDIISRFKRMQGFDVLWLPGMDHAAISTEARVVARLKKQGIDKYELGREGFLEECWKWTNEHRDFIHEQWETLGISVDYNKERFTLDEGLNYAVNTVFIRLYEKGLIYRGERIINWDPVAGTALSNEEVIYKDDEGYEHYFKYYFKDDPEKYLTIMTTRPETIFGDGAIAVNPNDDRYKDIVGKIVLTPIANNPIPIIADDYVSMDKGSGCVKITPAHDPNDFEVGLRHDIRKDIIMDPDGKMSVSEMVPLAYQGLDRYDARRKFIEDAKTYDRLLRMDKIIHSVGHSERTDAVVEPYLSKQWFVKMGSMAKDLLDNQKTDNKVNFIPKKFEKILNNWMENCHDWCISRQLWWGHRIPVWYKDEKVFVGYSSPGDDWEQDPDVLDTWFSSALWPFSTLGWPDSTEDLERYFPTDVLVTAYEIIFFWVARMMFSALEQVNDIPFKDCIMHGLVRAKDGRKMSKSLDNGIDPIDMIELYGTDSLRFYLTTTSAMGTDIRFDPDKVKSTWNFVNKLWNASRFVLMNIEAFNRENYAIDNLSIVDKWILTKCNKIIKNVTKNMEKYEFNNVGSELYSFIWNDFCDNYIELSKNNLNSNITKSVLLKVLTDILKMLHPFMPYVTEEIYLMLPIHDESIMISAYPEYNKQEIYKEDENIVDKLIEDLTNIRNLRANNNISKKAFILFDTSEDLRTIYKIGLRVNEENIINNPKEDFESYNYKSNLIDITYYEEGNSLDKDSIIKEMEKLELSISKRKNLLANENYINKAPINVVEQDRIKLAEEEEKLQNLKNMI